MPNNTVKSQKLKVKNILLKIFLIVSFFFTLYPLPFTLHAFADQSISVTGTLPPKDSDFQLSAETDHTGTVAQNTTITYTITYGSHLYYAGQVTVEAQWAQGTISGASSPSVDGLNYVAGSASTAYAGTSPTIDLVNKKIDWTIASFPSQTTDQTVTFSLKTNASYTGSNTVSFPITFKIITPNFTTSVQTISQTYQFDPTQVTPTPTAATPTVSPTPTPTTLHSTFYFTSIDFRSVSPQSISLDVAISQDAMVTAHFGLSKTDLNNLITTKTYATNHTIVLEGLTENTTYYVKLTATTPSGMQTISDMYVFHTGKLSEIPQIDLGSLTYVASNILLYVGKENVATTPETSTQPSVIILPPGFPYTIRFQMSKTENSKRLQAVLRNKYVLGITTDNTEEPNTESTDLILTSDEFYQGRLKSPTLPGIYEEFVKIYDTSGNITEEKIADIHVSTPFLVINSKTNKPIEAAQVLLYYQDSQNHTFVLLPPQLFPVKNPAITNSQGVIAVPLPAGVYKAQVSALGYAPQEITFVLGEKINESYPTIKLIPEPFNLATTIRYYVSIVSDTLSSTKQYISDLSYSNRFFALNAFLISALLVLLTFVAFINKLHIPLFHLPSYFSHLLHKKQHTNTVYGQVIDEETKHPLAGVITYLLSMKTKKILSHTLTNEQGEFSLTHAPESDFAVEILADGFEQSFFPYEKLHLNEHGECTLSIKKRQLPLSMSTQVIHWTENTLAFFFEILLVLSLLFEISFGYALGWEKATVFLVLSIANLGLWIFNLTKRRSFTLT